MQHSEFHFEGMNGYSLYAQCWLPEVSPRAVIAIVHGIGDHSGRYMNIVNHLVSNQIAVYGYDQRGHGNSPGQRGHIDSWLQYSNDLLNFINVISTQQSGHLIYLLGHSMGALVVLDFIQWENEQIAGAIVSGAPIEPVGLAKPFKVAVARILSRIYPGFAIDLGLDDNAISRIPAVVKAYQDDPLVHGRVSARWGTEVLSTLESVKMWGESISTPLLMLHGGGDQINSAEGAKVFFDRIQASDKEFISYPAGYHELHNDLDNEIMLSDLLAWINRHEVSPGR
ncbi:alpha/beta hydrolase [Candidatus Fermentibacteria bacterium]|nr:MAG: alpha/beta hydrolase [Candidatus Fermentibacteria bacterium]